MKLKNKKTGEIKELRDIMSDMIDNHIVPTLIAIENEWEDYEEPKEHCYINVFGEVQCRKPEEDIIPVDTELIDKLREIGNYFETKEEALKAVRKLKAWKRLKDKGFRFNSWLDNGAIEFTMPRDEQEWSPSVIDDLDLLFGGEE